MKEKKKKKRQGARASTSKSRGVSASMPSPLRAILEEQEAPTGVSGNSNVDINVDILETREPTST